LCRRHQKVFVGLVLGDSQTVLHEVLYLTNRGMQAKGYGRRKRNQMLLPFGFLHTNLCNSLFIS
jgi:hypothetical protein